MWIILTFITMYNKKIVTATVRHDEEHCNQLYNRNPDRTAKTRHKDQNNIQTLGKLGPSINLISIKTKNLLTFVVAMTLAFKLSGSIIWVIYQSTNALRL